MKPVAVGLLSGGAGFVAGALAYGWFAAHTIDSWNRVVQSQFSIEQEFRASRAERQGDRLAALHHQWNAVDASSADWLHRFQTWETPPPWFAVYFAILGKMADKADPERKGARVAHGIARGYLAWLLEANGYKDRAAEQWRRAAELTGLSDPLRLRGFVGVLRAQRQTELQRQAEEAVLGPEGPAP